MKAWGEMMLEVHGIEKELDPHMKPEQQYLSKGVTPKKIVKMPEPGSTSKEGCRRQIDTQSITPPKGTTKMGEKGLTESPTRTLQRSPQPRALLPMPINLRTCQKGDNNGESVENEEPEGTLKYTR